MALPYYHEEEPGALTKEARGKALIKLVATVLAVDAVSVVVYLVLVLELGWDEMTPLIPLIVITVITGCYFQWKLKKITG